MIDRLTRRQVIGGLAVGRSARRPRPRRVWGWRRRTAAGATTAAGNQSHGGSAVAVVEPGPVVAPRDPDKPFPAQAPPRSSTRVHAVEVEVDEHLLEIAPDRTMMAWTFTRPASRVGSPAPSCG